LSFVGCNNIVHAAVSAGFKASTLHLETHSFARSKVQPISQRRA